MRTRMLGSGASALLLLATVAQAHKSAHEQLEAIHRRHHDQRLAKKATEAAEHGGVVRRDGQCQFPTDAGLVAITPGSANAGWAMSPDQTCTPGSYCPYACPPGQVMMQWDPKATSYTYPQSMNGGLYCDSNGQISKPFPNKPYCETTASNIGVINNAGAPVSFCQTVLPGNEAMLIPTEVGSSATLANPGTDYWAGTAAHYYINPPGKDASTACVWGSNNNPWGNWSPYVAGTNQDATGETFIKLGWNPIYLENTTPFRNQMPDWGVKIDCPNGGCNGLPCAIDPQQNHVNQMRGGASSGAGGGSFCVVTVAKGSQANFVVYGGGGDQGGQFYQSSAAASSSSTTAVASSTTTTATTTMTSSDESAANNSTSWDKSSSTTGWSMTNATSARSGPTGQPYYSLFDAPTGSASADAGATATGADSTKASVLPSTGGASTPSLSLVSLLLAAVVPLI